MQQELDALNQGLQKRQQAAKVKALLELMQDTAHVMSKVMTTKTTLGVITRWLLHPQAQATDMVVGPDP